MAEEVIVYLVVCDNYYNQYVAGVYSDENDAEDYIKKVLPLSDGTNFRIERHCLN